MFFDYSKNKIDIDIIVTTLICIMINEQLLDLQLLIFYIIGVIVFFLVYTRTKELKYYLPAYPFIPVGYFFYCFILSPLHTPLFSR